MSVLKKIGALAIGAGSAVGWLAVNATKMGFEAMADKVGKGSMTGQTGRTYTGSDFKDAAKKCKDDLFADGFKKAKDLWNETE